MFQLTATLMVMIGIAFLTVAFMFYCFWSRYSKFWKWIFILCSIYSWVLGLFTEIAGFLAIVCPELPKELLAAGFDRHLAVSAAVIILLWWTPWFGKNWRKVYANAKKSGYIKKES